MLSSLRVAGPDALERRHADGAALYCCPSGERQHDAAIWRVLLLKEGKGYFLADGQDACCPECGELGQRVSDVRTWRRS